MKTLFTYAVILHQYEQDSAASTAQAKKYKDSILIIEPKTILAKSDKEVLFKVTREIPEEFTTHPEDVQILIRPF